MKYLVTGCAGFIGSHLTERLLQEGHEVVGIDNLSTGFEEYLPKKNENFTFLKLDIFDWNSLTKHINYFKDVKCVFHLAACARIQPSIYSPSLTHDTNVTGTINILEIMRALNINQIVYSASSSYYGLKANIPSKETDPCDCQTPYSASKYMGELYCSTWSKIYKINSIRLRYFNVWGPRSPTSGNYAPVISLFFRQALLEESPMTVVGDGQQRRDFTHVDDVVSANIAAHKYMLLNSQTCIDKVYNIGTGKNYSILDIANMVKSSVEELKLQKHSFCKIKCNIVHISKRIGEAELSLADNSAAEKEIFWKPKESLQTMLSKLRDYYLNKEK